VRFLLDQDVDVAVAVMLRHHGHECLTASVIGLMDAGDDDLAVWADEHKRVLISTDRQFGQRRMKNAVGHHVWIRSKDWEAAGVLETHLDAVLELVAGRDAVTIRVSKDGIEASSDWQ
jgi:predicted nuclease of predicted toxin-antitoxin system